MEIDNILTIVVPVAFVALIVVVLVLARRAEQKRREALRQVAEQLGMEFAEQADELANAEFAQFHLFQQGRNRKAQNLLRGRVGTGHDRELVFDYCYVTGSGKNRHTHRQSVAAFALGGHGLPDFEFRPENVLHKIGAAFGYQDIDFPDYPGFSSRYLVRGKEEDAVRRLFDGTVLEAFENVRGISVEGGGGWLVIYRASRRLAPDKLADFLEEARRLRSAFARRAGSRV